MVSQWLGLALVAGRGQGAVPYPVVHVPNVRTQEIVYVPENVSCSIACYWYSAQGVRYVLERGNMKVSYSGRLKVPDSTIVEKYQRRNPLQYSSTEYRSSTAVLNYFPV